MGRPFFIIVMVMLALLLLPLTTWPVISSSTDVGLVIAVGLVVLSRPRWAWAVALAAAIIDETRSIIPFGLHLLAAVCGLGSVVVAHRRLVSGHSQSQVSVLVIISIVAARGALLLIRGIAVLVSSHWTLPTATASLSAILPTLVWSVAVTLVFWPVISRRWMPLQRISTWL